MGYYANAALERSYRERSCYGYPSREETLTYYLEDLQAMLSPHCDAARYAGVKGRYRYYEVPWAAAPSERDICAAIAEVERLLARKRYIGGDMGRVVTGVAPAVLLRAGYKNRTLQRK